MVGLFVERKKRVVEFAQSHVEKRRLITPSNLSFLGRVGVKSGYNGRGAKKKDSIRV